MNTEVKILHVEKKDATWGCLILWMAFFFFPSYTFAQDTLNHEPDTVMNVHSPRKATIMSAVLPGLGQVYNRQYWKVPVIYAGMGTCVYFFLFNNRWRLYYHSLDVPPEQKQLATEAYLYYERNRELSIMLFGAIYLLNVIDATVDAYLFTFDVSKNLSLHITPSLMNYSSAGFSCYFRF